MHTVHNLNHKDICTRLHMDALKHPDIKYDPQRETERECGLKITAVTLVKSGVGPTNESSRTHYRGAGLNKKNKKRTFFNTIAAATAYIKSRDEHDAEPRGLPSSSHLLNPK